MGRRGYGLPKGSGNYPPGAKNDPRAPYNQKDHTHDHEWRSIDEHLEPVIEDGAAIFHDECMYAEGRWGEGWQCEEERYYRFEYSSLTMPSGAEIEVPPLSEWEEESLTNFIRSRIIIIEQAHNSDCEDTEIDADPDPEMGVVEIEHEGYTLRFEA